MAYRLKVTEPLIDAVPRILIEQIERIRRDGNQAGNPTTAVHETRKSLKRIRALLRLVKPGLKGQVFETENARYRAIAHALAPSRDRDVLAETLMRLASEARSDEAEAITKLKPALLSAKLGNGHSGHAADISEALKQAEDAARQLIVEGDTEVVAAGLKAAYKKGRGLQRRAYDEDRDEVFHDLRKAVQLHWRHMQLLQKAWPELFSARIEMARRLSQMLGDVQDMAVLIEAIKSRDDLDDDAASAVVGAARASQRKARRQTPALGEQLFAQRSRDFAKSTVAVWTAAGNLE